MGAMTTDYSKHGDINCYIAEHHPKKEQFGNYRKQWEHNKESLLFLLIETISRCNLKCPMCIHSVGYEHTADMTENLFDRIIKEIKAMRIPSIAMNMTNEPLLDKSIINRIAKIAQVDCVVDILMNTNGVLLNKQNGEKLLDSGLTRLLIGFDAYSKNTYEKVRVGSNYEKVLHNILDFLELKEKLNKNIPVVRMSFVKTSQNEHEVQEWFDFWKDKVDYVSIQEYLTPVLNDSGLSLVPKNSKRKELKGEAITCKQPFERVTIIGNGDVLPCCSHFSTQMPIGNINNDSLLTIWNGEMVNTLRKYFKEKRWREHPICSKCLGISSGLKLSEFLGDIDEDTFN